MVEITDNNSKHNQLASYDENITEWRRENEIQSLVIRDYFGIDQYEVHWNMERIEKPFKTTAFHRTLTEYFQSLHENDFLVTRLVEPKPAMKTVMKYSSLRKRLKIPQSIIVEAIKGKQ